MKAFTRTDSDAPLVGRGWFSNASVDLWLLSFITLFFELAVIRWIPSNISLLSYFSNVVLISCFLGLGTGCILRSRRDLYPYVGIATFLLIVAAAYLHRHGLQMPLPGEVYFFGATGKYRWLYMVPAIFLITALPFITIGQRLAAMMDGFTPLRGYSINLFGSLCGSVAFAFLSFLGKGPVAWFVLAFALLCWLLRYRPIALAMNVLCFIVSLLFVQDLSKTSIWSPYYKIELQTLAPKELGGRRVIVNEDYHQLILNLNDSAVQKNPGVQHFKRTYDFPYELLGTRPGKVLVLGAGTGNDVAAALRAGATLVDAVELDPALLELGLFLHPERPYSNPKVRLHTNDARNFIRNEDGTYNTIVLGWLDSHRLFSSLSNVRQDNFVYTVESMKRIRSLLGNDGVLFLSFYVGRPWLGEKIYSMLKEAFGHAPAVFAYPGGGFGMDGQTFVISANPQKPVAPEISGFVNLSERFHGTQAEFPTDDWPYLYYRKRGMTSEYLYTVLLLIGLSAAVVFVALPKGKVSYREATHFFFMGAGFLLLEVRNITSLALSFGSTWLVTSIAISALFVMALLANLIVSRHKQVQAGLAVWLGLFATIALAAFWHEGLLPFDQTWLQSLSTVFVASIAFLFTGIIFARSFSLTQSPGRSLGFNVLGGVIGGLAEHLSLAAGITGISLLALAFYLVAYVSRPHRAIS